MKRSLREIYALAVCFVAVICMAVASAFALYDVVQFTAPQITLGAYQYDAVQSNAAFRRSYPFLLKKNSSEADMTKIRQETYAQDLKAQRRIGAQSLIRMAIFILVGVVVFVVHWKVAKRARESVYA